MGFALGPASGLEHPGPSPNPGQSPLILFNSNGEAQPRLKSGGVAVAVRKLRVAPHWVVAVSHVLHGIAALLMLGIHVYERAAQQTGTFRSMIDDTVLKEWACSHHPGWYAEVTTLSKSTSKPSESNGLSHNTTPKITTRQPRIHSLF